MHECVYMRMCVYGSIGQCVCDGCADAASVCMYVDVCVFVCIYTFIQSLTLVTKISFSSRGQGAGV